MTVQAGLLPKVYKEVSRWRAGGARTAATAVLPFILALALWRLAASDGGRHAATLTAVQTLVLVLCALLIGLGSLRRAALLRPLAALFAAVALSAAWSVRPDSSLRELLLWTTYLGIVAIVSSSLASPRGARHFTDAIIVIGAWLSLIGLLYIFWAANPGLRWYSTFYAPNAFAAFLLLVLPLALARAVMARGRRDAFQYAAMAVLLGTAFILTYSRGAYVALLLTSVAAAAVFRPAGRSAVGRLALMAALTVFCVTLLIRTPGSVVNRTTEILDSSSSSIQDRLGFWRSAAGIFRDYPLTGSGPGTFAFVHGKYQGRYYAQDAHNLYLQTLAELGLVGAAAFAGVLVAFGSLWRRTLRKARGTEEYGLIAGIGLSLLAFLVHSGVEMGWRFPANPAVAFALAGVLAWYDGWSVPRAGEPLGPGGPSRAFLARPALRVTAIILLIAAAAGVQLLRIADLEFARGRRIAAARRWSAALVRFERASALNPLDPRAPAAQAAAVQQLGRPDDVAALIRRSMALDRMNAYYPLQLAEALAPGFRDDATAGELERLLLHALELDPFHYPEGYRRLAQLYAAQGRSAQAGAVYARAAAFYESRTIAADPLLRYRLWPRVTAVYAEWAAFTASRGAVQDAVAVLDRLVRQDPTWQPAYRQIADLYLRAGLPREAALALVAGWAQRPDALAQSPRPSRLWIVFPRVYPR